MAVDSDPIASTDKVVNVNICCSNGNKFPVKTNLELTVHEFKTVLAGNCNVPPEQQRLIYRGMILKDDQTLNSYGLQADHTVHMVPGFAPATPTASTPTNVMNASNSPNAMRDIRTSRMQNLMNTPEFMLSVLILRTPELRDRIDRNPFLRHVLNDPSILRLLLNNPSILPQIFGATRNPVLMSETMRNTDRAMSNIESSPGGFNARRRVYENVQERLMNTTTMAGSGAAADSGFNPFAALLGNHGGNQTGEVPSLPAGSETTSGTAVPNTNPLPNPWNNNGTGITRTNPTGGAPSSPIAELGGLGLPDVGMLDPSLYSQLLQNRARSQSVRSSLSDPQYMEQMANPYLQLRTMMLNINTQLREMMQNPDVRRQFRLRSPELMQQLMAMRQQLSHVVRQLSTTERGAQLGQYMGNQMDTLIIMFGAPVAGAGGMNVPSNPNVPPEELYATQLSEMQEMGFLGTEENIRALRATSGNVNAAVERLLNDAGL